MSDEYDDRGRQQPPPPPPPPPGSSGGAGNWNGPGAVGGSSWEQQSGGWQQQSGGWGADQQRGPQPAGVGIRIGAYIIDAIIVGIVNAIVAVIVTIPFAVNEGTTGVPFVTTGNFLASFIVGLLGAAVTLAYFGILESRNGQTLGKRLLNIRAVTADMGQLELPDAVKRRIPFVIGSIIPIPFIGPLVSLGLAIAIIVTTATDQPWHRGLHDKWAGSMVVQT